MKQKLDSDILDAMRRNPNNWKGVFYVNPKDPALIVPKLQPAMGWTFNFGCAYTYLFLIAFLLIILATRYLF